jgi:hypothetical protein
VFDLRDFDLHDIFQEYMPGVKQDLPVIYKLRCIDYAVATVVDTVNHLTEFKI